MPTNRPGYMAEYRARKRARARAFAADWRKTDHTCAGCGSTLRNNANNHYQLNDGKYCPTVGGKCQNRTQLSMPPEGVVRA